MRNIILKDHKEMLLLPGLPPEAISRTLAVAEAARSSSIFLPIVSRTSIFPPERRRAPTSGGSAMRGLPVRYGGISDEVKEDLEQELALIERKGLCGYFLIVWDIMEFARRSGILSQGRGSAASSLVAYLLGITPVDPIRHGLFVGRFLNESCHVPDIDIDIDTQRREEVIRYVYEKYGEEHAAMVCTYVTFRARNAIREVGKVFGFPPHILDRMAKSVSAYSPASAIEDLKEVPEFGQYLDSAAWGHFCALSREIADFPRHLSIHVGGMIISSRPISEMVPVERARAAGAGWSASGTRTGSMTRDSSRWTSWVSVCSPSSTRQRCSSRRPGGQRSTSTESLRTTPLSMT